MAITHGQPTRDAFALQVLTDLDAEAGVAQCILVTGGTGGTEVATMDLSKPSFVQASEVLTLDITPIPTDSAATGNASAVDAVDFVDSLGVVVFTSNDVSGTDFTLSKNPIANGDTVELTSCTYTASV